MGLITAERLKHHFPAIDIDYLAADETCELVEGHPALNRVHVLPRAALNQALSQEDYSGLLADLTSWIKELQTETYDLSVNLFQENFGGVLQSLVKARSKIGLQLDDRGPMRVVSRALEHLFAIPAARPQNPWHAVDIYVRACIVALRQDLPPGAAPLHLSAYTPNPEVGLNPLPANDLPILLHPGSAWPGKRWPAPHWVRLAHLLVEAGHTLVLTGAPEEKTLAELIMHDLPESTRPRVDNQVGCTRLRDMPERVRSSSLVVSGDTLTMHLAALTGKRCIALFGASNPIETGPYGPGHFILQIQPPHTPKLALSDPSPSLAEITSETVAGLILRGRIPTKIPLWETTWDDGLQAQILRDPQHNPHPYQQGSGRRLPLFAPSLASSSLQPPAYPPISPSPWNTGATELLSALESARLQPNALHLQRVEQLEADFSLRHANNIIWEAYRIAINGLNTLPLDEFLNLRKMRLHQAISEIQDYFG